MKIRILHRLFTEHRGALAREALHIVRYLETSEDDGATRMAEAIDSLATWCDAQITWMRAGARAPPLEAWDGKGIRWALRGVLEFALSQARGELERV